MQFRKISQINIKNNKSWKNKIFITIDIDWCDDEVLEHSINIFEKKKIPVTWFITHKTKLLRKLRENKNFEIGIHPNFNNILQSNKKKSNAKKVIKNLLKIVPEAKSVRSHALTQSSLINDLFYKNKLLYECNSYIPISSGIITKPWKNWDNLIKVPYFWEDYIYCLEKKISRPKKFLQSDSVKVFNFHPIHIFLNTENISRYLFYKKNKNKLNVLAAIINKKKYGTRNFLNDLIKKCDK